MFVKIAESAFDPIHELEIYQNQISEYTGKFGATCIFIGTMRDFNAGDLIAGMTLEHYPGMTEKCISESIQDAEQRWTLLDTLVIHRVGDVFPNQPIVLVAVWASHRGDAFDACRAIMENLKSKAPFWKKEFLNTPQAEHRHNLTAPDEINLASVSRWVSENTNGYAEKNI